MPRLPALPDLILKLLWRSFGVVKCVAIQAPLVEKPHGPQIAANCVRVVNVIPSFVRQNCNKLPVEELAHCACCCGGKQVRLMKEICFVFVLKYFVGVGISTDLVKLAT